MRVACAALILLFTVACSAQSFALFEVSRTSPKSNLLSFTIHSDTDQPIKHNQPKFYHAVNQPKCDSHTHWIPSKDNSISMEKSITLADFEACLESKITTSSSGDWIGNGKVADVSFEMNQLSPNFLMVCSSKHDSELVRWKHVSIVHQGEVATLWIRIEGSSIPDYISGRHTRLGLMTFRRDITGSNHFKATVILHGKQVIEDGDALLIITHTPIVCHVVSTAAMQISANTISEGKSASVPENSKAHKRSLSTTLKKVKSITVSSDTCVAIPRPFTETKSVYFHSVELCAKLGKRSTCHQIPDKYLARKAVPQDGATLTNVIYPEQSPDLCLLDAVKEIRTLLKEKPLVSLAAFKKTTQTRNINKLLEEYGQLTDESAVYVDAAYRLQLVYSFINPEVDTHVYSGSHFTKTIVPIHIRENTATLGALSHSKRSDDNHNHNNTHDDDDDSDEWIVSESSFPLWAQIVLVLILAGVAVFIVVYLVIWSRWDVMPASRYVNAQRVANM
jgi:hypothetical protein